MSYKYQLAFTYFIDQEPIWRDMAFAKAGIIACQRVVAIFRRQRLAISEHTDHIFQQCDIVAALNDTLVIFFEKN